MKKIGLVIVLLLVVSLLVSCVPVEPKDMLPYCKAQYETLLLEDPDFPQAFVGACVSNLQTGKATAFVSLCRYEPFRARIAAETGISMDTRQDCVIYIRNYEE